MKLQTFIKKARKFSRPFRVTDGRRFRLEHTDPGDRGGPGAEDRPRAKEAMDVEKYQATQTQAVAAKSSSSR